MYTLFILEGVNRVEKVCCEIAKETETIKWNPYNEVVQCHSCGHVYVPKDYSKQVAQ